MKFRQSLFWDSDPDKINPQEHAQYIIERIMDFGNDKEVHWMKNFYPKSLLSTIAKASKTIQPSSKKFWTLLTK